MKTDMMPDGHKHTRMKIAGDFHIKSFMIGCVRISRLRASPRHGGAMRFIQFDFTSKFDFFQPP
jgi:hypothetical protein